MGDEVYTEVIKRLCQELGLSKQNYHSQQVLAGNRHHEGPFWQHCKSHTCADVLPVWKQAKRMIPKEHYNGRRTAKPARRGDSQDSGGKRLVGGGQELR